MFLGAGSHLKYSQWSIFQKFWRILNIDRSATVFKWKYTVVIIIINISVIIVIIIIIIIYYQ